MSSQSDRSDNRFCGSTRTQPRAHTSLPTLTLGVRVRWRISTHHSRARCNTAHSFIHSLIFPPFLSFLIFVCVRVRFVGFVVGSHDAFKCLYLLQWMNPYGSNFLFYSFCFVFVDFPKSAAKLCESSFYFKFDFTFDFSGFG